MSHFHPIPGSLLIVSDSNMCPRPQVGGDDSSPQNPFIPVPPNPHFTRKPQVDEKTALVMNIVIPQHPAPDDKKFPVLAWVHGGSLLYGSANYGIYDAVNLVSHSVAIGLPIVAVNFNYRLGLGGFLANSKIAKELEEDGFAGNGNFGFTDQKVAMDWVQSYIAQLGGDPDNVTAVGQSAGGVSIGHHLAAKNPMKFHRAICMSGLGSTLPALSLEGHEAIFNATCRYFSIDADAPDALDQLRKVDEQALANADHIIQGVPSGVGNPCNDGWFYAHDPKMNTEVPNWLKSFLIGDVGDEGVIFTANLQNDTYETITSTLMNHVQDEIFVKTALEQYISPNASNYIPKTCDMGGDAFFKIQNYITAQVNKRLQQEQALFKYHFDQRSRIPNVLEGRAYHGLDVLYLFGNLDNKLSEGERAMAADCRSAWMKFIHGQPPWQSDYGIWKIWGPDSKEKVETEAEDETVRRYSRFKLMLALGSVDGLWEKFLTGMDYLLEKRDNVGKFG